MKLKTQLSRAIFLEAFPCVDSTPTQGTRDGQARKHGSRPLSLPNHQRPALWGVDAVPSICSSSATDDEFAREHCVDVAEQER